jgi:hypothetical protein
MVTGSHEAAGAGGARQDRGAVASLAAKRAARAGWGLGAATIHWGKRPAASRPVAVTRRDRRLLALLHDVNYLSASQMALLGWGGDSTCARRRLRLLHDHGLIDKFRPAAAAGSYDWNYRLTVEGWRVLKNCGRCAEEKPYAPADIHSIAYVEHDLQVNALVLDIARRARTGDGPLVRCGVGDGEGLRGLALARPDPGAYALVKRVWCEVCAARPAHRPRLGIDANLGKAVGSPGALEHRAAHTVQHVDLAGCAIGEGEPQGTVPRNRRVGYIWGKSDHRSGSISFSVAPSRARRQFSSSSAACISAHASTSRSSRRGRSLASTSNESIWTLALCPAARA